ncbi:sugar ABC transporter ATP-binding protein [Streptomyces sioyaensis]|uniref:sugar ABC transporter ATP-binding protein n=1 Tax=Streptomyces sioyaensis TaxID=67364 RepID=UPI003D710CC3
MTSTIQAPVVDLQDIHKAFGGNQVLRGISLRITPGAVVGLLGENGAGKSTLIRILNGEHRPDSGTMAIAGEETSFSSPADAIRRGIATVHQESGLSPFLDVGANLMLGREATEGGSRVFLSRRKLRARAVEILDRSGFDLELSTLAKDLSVGQRQMVEIARALAVADKLLILDEPTAALAPAETALLFEGVRRIAALGHAILFVSHRLQEVSQLCDRVVVLRDGKCIGELDQAQADEHSMISMMLGREISAMFPARKTPGTNVVLRADAVRAATGPEASLQVKAGEIVGLTGLLDAGQRGIARAIYGADPREHGTVQVDGELLRPNRPDLAIGAGVVYVSGDRHADGVMGNLSVEQSLVLPELRKIRMLAPTPARRLKHLAADLRARFGVKTHSMSASITTLSGGNQQKVLIARWLAHPPTVLILDDPTLGVDVGSKSEIYELIGQLAAQGTAILLVSADSTEVLGMCHRILVMRRGNVVADIDGATATEADVLHHAMGVPVANINVH